MAEESKFEKEIVKEEKKIAKATKKFFSNFWAVAAVVLAILLVIVLLMNNGVSKTKAGEIIINFAQEQGANATLVSVEDKGSVYEVVVKIDSQEVPVYITKDGKNLVPSLIPLTQTASDTPNTNNPDTTPTEVPKTDKPIVELFVMSYCPYGTQIEKGIIPVANLLKDKIDFKLKFVYYAMHPTSGEVEENTRQYCIQKEQSSKFIPYLTCFLKEGKSDACLTEAGVDKTKLNACYSAADKVYNITSNLNDKSSWLSGSYPKYNVDLADNNKYQVGGSPTLIINGVEAQSGRDSSSLLNSICSAFNTAPAECSQQLSSESPSPGLGFTTTGAATSNTAQCG